MGIIKKFKSFFDDKNVDKYYWFDDEYKYLIDMGFSFSGDLKVGVFKKGNVKIEKKAFFSNGEEYYYILTINDKQRRFETFSELKDSLEE